MPRGARPSRMTRRNSTASNGLNFRRRRWIAAIPISRASYESCAPTNRWFARAGDEVPRIKPQPPIEAALDDARLVDRVRAALVGIPKVDEKRMFGGTGFMVRGHLCITARPARIMCRIDPSTHDAAIKRKGSRTVIMRGRKYRGYVHVD